jgi:4-diphosphocytidyl-2-C-methyl-D-erythritol kinase
MSVTVRAPAKINLHLGVGPGRDDGYHELATVYQAIGLYDDVTATEAPGWSVTMTVSGELDASGVPLGEDNIAIRAGRALTEHHGVDLSAHLAIAKSIPVAGGLAGGSADAAATLVALDRLWDAGTTDDDLLDLAGQLGSDVPFALIGGTAHGTGRGEVVEPLTDAGTYWWVVLPAHEGLSTPSVYAEFDRLHPDLPVGVHHDEPPGLLHALEGGDALVVAQWLRNDLQTPALSLRPELGDRLTLVEQQGAVAALLSGSGPTVLGLAADQDEARELRLALTESGQVTVHVAAGPVAGAHVVEYV